MSVRRDQEVTGTIILSSIILLWKISVIMNYSVVILSYPLIHVHVRQVPVTA